MLFNIFECTESTGELLTESYLQKDCTKSCYTGHHMSFAIGGGFLLIIYISLCSYLRIFYELIQYSLNFATSPKYLLILNIFQVLVVVIHKNLDYFGSGTSGFVISLILLIFAVLTFYLHPYNYRKINRIQVSVLIVSGIIIMFSSIYEFYDENIYIYYLFFPCSCLSMIGLFYWIQVSNDFFIPDNDEDIPNLIQFQFGASTRIDNEYMTS